jgi:hypothetical protein
MKLNAKLFLTLLCCAFTGLQAQVNTYLFTQGYETYTEISGGSVEMNATTISGADALIDVYKEVTLPFTFYFNGSPYTKAYINSNGSIHFGASSVSASPISGNGVYSGAFAGFAREIRGIHIVTGNVTSGSATITSVSNTKGIYVGYKLTGTGIPVGATVAATTATTITLSAPATATAAGTNITQYGRVTAKTSGTGNNRSYTIQFKGFSTVSTTEKTLINFQMRLNEGGGNATNQSMNVVYGDFIAPVYYTNTIEVGLRGGSNSDFFNRDGWDNWATTNDGTKSYSSCAFSDGVFPSSGLKFTYGNTQVINGLQEEAQLAGVSVFPNPASGVAHINFNNAEGKEVNIRISDVLGRVVWSRDMQGAQGGTELNTNTFEKGIYFIHTTIGNAANTTRLIVN